MNTVFLKWGTIGLSYPMLHNCQHCLLTQLFSPINRLICNCKASLLLFSNSKNISPFKCDIKLKYNNIVVCLPVCQQGDANFPSWVWWNLVWRRNFGRGKTHYILVRFWFTFFTIAKRSIMSSLRGTVIYLLSLLNDYRSALFVF